MLKSAAALARERPNEPAALAGAADVISLVGSLDKRPDSMTAHILTSLNRRRFSNAASVIPGLQPAAVNAVRERYFRALDASLEADVTADPTAVALCLYGVAYQKDRERVLQHLPLRLYLLQVCFDPIAASHVLTEEKRRQPGNAAVALEEARAAFLLEDRPTEGWNHLREAAARSLFSRSCLVAIPPPLRSAGSCRRTSSPRPNG